MQINVAVTDANNIVCTIVPPQVQTITIDRGVAGNGIVSIVPVTISTFQYLRITYTNGTVSDVGPLTSTAYTATAPINITGNTISLLTVPIATGGTGATTAAAAIQNLLPSYTANGNKRLGLNAGATALEWVADGGGTVTSVAFSGGSTGLTSSGGPITSSGTITLAGTLAIANGGTGQTTANTALNALLPAQTGNATKYLQTDGTNATWDAISLSTADITGVLPTANGGTGLSAFTANQVFYASSTSAIAQSSNLQFNGTMLTAGSITNLALTPGRVTYTGSGNILTDSANLTFNGTNLTLAAGIANRVAFLDVNKVLTTDDSFSIVNGQVGIGTTTPNNTLQVTGALGGGISIGSGVNGTLGQLIINTGTDGSVSPSIFGRGNGLNEWFVGSLRAFTGGGALGMVDYVYGSNPRVFYTNGIERMRILGSGNVGIGTLTPTQPLDVNGNLAITGSARRITGDFSNATIASKVMFQTSTANSSSVLEVLPSGTGTATGFIFGNNSDVNNTSNFFVGTIGTTDHRLSGNTRGTGTYLPMTFYTGGSERVRIDTAGNILVGLGTTADAHLKIYGAGTTSSSYTNGDATGATLYLRDSGTLSGSGGQILFGSGFGVHAGIKGLVTNGTGPAGDLLFQTRSTSGNVDERMRINYLGNVGIGTSSPTRFVDIEKNQNASTVLRVGNTTSGTGAYSALQLSSNTNTFLYSFSSGYTTSGIFAAGTTLLDAGGIGGLSFNAASVGIIFNTGSSERARIDSSGNLGLGVTPSAWTSYIAYQVRNACFWGDDQTFASIGSNYYYNGGAYRYIKSGFVSTDYYQSLGSHIWRTAPSGTAGNAITFTQAMTLDASGNLGVGVTNPGHKLQVAGTAFIGGVTSTDATLNVLPGSGTKGKTSFTVYGATFGASWGGGDTGTRTVFRSGASNTGLDAWTTMVYDIDSNQSDAPSWVNRLRINGNTGDVLLGNNGGNLLVGTPTAISGFTQITVVGSSTNRGSLQMGRTTAATTGVAGSLVAYNGSNAICGIDWQSNGANNSGYIGTYTYNAGSFAQGPYLNTGGTNWTAASDERLKNVTGEIENALYKVSQIRAVEFTWKADTLNKQNIGFIAQDVQVVLPEVIDTDTNGNLGVRYAEVTALLLAAIKEQQAIITALTARVASLESN